jgi:hypothetical protein
MIKKVLQQTCPESKRVKVIDVYHGEDGTAGYNSGIAFLIAKRARGDLRPMVIYGFDSLERLKQREGGSILNDPGVFYLKLPALFPHVKSILQKAANFKVFDQDVVDNESIRRYAIQRIRAFKHTCDNVWMSMEGNTNAARSSLNDSPGTKPSSLKEFRQVRIERLAEEYSQLKSLTARLGIEGAEQLPNIMAEVIDMTGQIHKDSVSPQEAVELAAECVKKMQDVAKILSKVKELEHNE